MKILLATRNEHKIREARSILEKTSQCELMDLDGIGLSYREEEENLEPYDTFEQNAESKARYFHELSGLPTVADDSGLVVDCLKGAPGVNSKRFSPWSENDGISRDESNNKYLIECLNDHRDEKWIARYICVAAFVESGNNLRLFQGEVEGEILATSRGHGGFGYDPHFFVEALDLTFAEVSQEEKNHLSHRGRAFLGLVQEIDNGL